MGESSVSPRPPTRCPVCKGAVIERMPSPGHGSFIWFFCLFCNHTWKFHIDDARASPNGELGGNAFIVTKNGKKIRLGSVGVKAIPEDALKKHLKSRMLQGELENRKLLRKIDRLTATLETAKAEEQRLWKIQKLDESNLQKGKAWSVAYNKTKDIAGQIERLQAQRRQPPSGENFFRGLPSPISTAKTDADGEFTLRIPLHGRFGIVARAAAPDPGDERKEYFWFVWVSLDGQSSKRLMLSNDNMMGAGSPDSALD